MVMEVNMEDIIKDFNGMTLPLLDAKEGDLVYVADCFEYDNYTSAHYDEKSGLECLQMGLLFSDAISAANAGFRIGNLIGNLNYEADTMHESWLDAEKVLEPGYKIKDLYGKVIHQPCEIIEDEEYGLLKIRYFASEMFEKDGKLYTSRYMVIES